MRNLPPISLESAFFVIGGNVINLQRSFRNIMTSSDKTRKIEDHKRHPESNPYPHPPHQVIHKTILAPDHDPHHTKPDPNDESIDHGVYEDRPRPPKINKTNLQLQHIEHKHHQ
jgi:hypothetical protein